MNALFNRKSIRQYRDIEVEDKKIEKLLKAGMQAPSAHNTQPWEFIVVQDPIAIEKIALMSKYASPAHNSPCCIITLCNMNNVKDKKTEDWIQQDMSACTENILIQAVEEDLGAVWLGTYPDEERSNYLKELFNVPEHIIPFSVIVVGYPKDKYEAEDRFDETKIHYEVY